MGISTVMAAVTPAAFAQDVLRLADIIELSGGGATVGQLWRNGVDLAIDDINAAGGVGGRKLAGVLIETRWRGTAPDWVAIGFGINVAQPALDTAIGLGADATRLGVLARLVPALRRAAAASRHLSAFFVITRDFCR